MEETQFDILLRNAAQQTTRRGALATLVGGALLLNSRGEVGATDKAKRRRKRKQKRTQQQKRNFPFNGVMVTVFNYAHAMNYSAGTSGTVTSCCKYLRDARLEYIGNTTVISNPLESAWFWLDDGKYWFEFTDPVVGEPFVRIAVNGRHRIGGDCCLGIPWGQSVEAKVSFDMGQTREFNIAGQKVSIFRAVNFDQPRFHLQIGSFSDQR